MIFLLIIGYSKVELIHVDIFPIPVGRNQTAAILLTVLKRVRVVMTSFTLFFLNNSYVAFDI